MRQRKRLPASTAGAVTKLCPGPCGGNRIQLSMAACVPCWRDLPAALRAAWLAAKDGDCDSGPALVKAQAEIETRLREAVAR
jgi:hypothetical protein